MWPFFEKISLAHASPFYDLLRSSFDRTFETRMRSFWKKQFEEQKMAELVREADFIADEKYFLNFEDFHGVFYIQIKQAVSFAFHLNSALKAFIFSSTWNKLCKHLFFTSVAIAQKL